MTIDNTIISITNSSYNLNQIISQNQSINKILNLIEEYIEINNLDELINKLPEFIEKLNLLVALDLGYININSD